MWRVVRLTVFGLAGTLGLIICVLLPDLVRFAPTKVRVYWAEELFVLCFVAHAVGRRLAEDWFPTSRFVQRAAASLAWLNRFSDWALGADWRACYAPHGAGLLLMWVCACWPCALLFYDLMPERPRMCDLGESYWALRPLVRLL